MASVRFVNGGAEIQVKLDKGDVIECTPTGLTITNAPTLVAPQETAGAQQAPAGPVAAAVPAAQVTV